MFFQLDIKKIHRCRGNTTDAAGAEKIIGTERGELFHDLVTKPRYPLKSKVVRDGDRHELVHPGDLLLLFFDIKVVLGPDKYLL